MEKDRCVNATVAGPLDAARRTALRSLQHRSRLRISSRIERVCGSAHRSVTARARRAAEPSEGLAGKSWRIPPFKDSARTLRRGKTE
jgi:hypothetical protein